MKTLIHNETKQSKYIWADAVVITLGEKITIAPDFSILDMNSTNATMVENITPPEDWVGCKYLYDAGTWTLNTDWIDPAHLER